MLLAGANKLLASSFRDLMDVFVPTFSPPMPPTRWESGRWSEFFGCRRGGREESGGRTGSQTLGFWLEVRISEASCLRSGSLGSRARDKIREPMIF